GMVERCDFSEQVVVQGEDGGLRPDMVVHLPDDRDIVVDVKTPLDAYLTAQAASDPEARDKALALHARNVRQRVKQLADKKYWEQFENSPDFAVLFIPGDQFLTAALDRDDALLEDALRERVILATPTSLVALLRAVAFSWRQVALMENAREIRSLAEEFHKRVGVFSEHFARLQRSLQGSVDAFNKSVGSLNRQVLPSARRLTELGVAERREILSSDDIETPVRPVPDVDSSDGAAADDEE
ncbi:MAG: DNA recombination protein RmuC, partial [Pseudomonadota bacterium]